MIQLRSLRGLAAAATMLLAGAAGSLHAQGVTTGAISGVVTDQNGHPVDNAQIEVVNQATGVKTGAITRTDGRYNVLGLEVGSSYSVTARRIGFQPTTQDNIRVALSQATRVDLALHEQAAVLQGVTVTAQENSVISPTHTGVATTVSDSALRRLPSLSRNFTDFVTLTPQVSTTLNNGGLSGGGVNNRFNQVMIDGASETDLFGLGSTGQPGGQADGKSIGIESVKEYQVLLSPFDVRQGNFAGLLVNAVTKSGTNEFHGSAYTFYKNQNLVRSQDYISDFNETQYGLSLGGPIVKNKVFFFINPEFQVRHAPANGLYLGAPGFNLDQPTVDRFTSDLANYGVPAGSAGRVTNGNPLANVFARVDVNDLPFNSSLVLRYNYGHATEDIFSRGAIGTSKSFPLSTNGYQFTSRKDAPALQLRTHFSNGAFNEFLASYTRIRDRRGTPVKGPQITVTTPDATLIAGTERSSQGNELDQDIIELTDNFTLPIGAHNITIGTQNEFYKVRNLFTQNSYGVWNFSSLDNFENGIANGYMVGVPVQANSDGAVRFKAGVFAGYVQDQWTVNNRLTVTGGLRADVPYFSNRPPTNPSVLTAFGRNTNDIPSGHIQLSPRVGFNWDVTGNQKNQLRGGLGLFTGHPAYVWLSNAFQNSGLTGVAQLNCNASNAPAFNAAAVTTPPTTCTDGSSAKAGGGIDVLEPSLRFPQTGRLTLGYDRDLGHNLVATIEGLYTKAIYAPFYQNIALLGPQGTDAHGRVLYGMQPGRPALVDSVNKRTQVIDVSNENKDYSYNLTVGLQRRFANRWEGSAFYTYTRAKDVESLTSSVSYSNWQFGRVYSGLQSDQNLTSSIFEQPHRIVVQGSYTFPTLTTLSLIYTGSSGTPYAYVYVAGGTSGDMNGDGSANNDPIYIPRDATDPTEMQFVPFVSNGDTVTAAQQGQALNQFINGASCLNKQRGTIMARNSCRAPWENLVNLSVRQSFRTLHMQNISVQLDVFNFLNLLNKDWGHQTFPFSDVPLLRHVGNTLGSAGTLASGQPTFQFDPTQQRFDFDNIESNYQLQLSVRYNF